MLNLLNTKNNYLKDVNVRVVTGKFDTCNTQTLQIFQDIITITERDFPEDFNRIKKKFKEFKNNCSDVCYTNIAPEEEGVST